MNTAGKLQTLINLLNQVDEDDNPLFPEELRIELLQEFLNDINNRSDDNESND
jgi:hypothetical protein